MSKSKNQNPKVVFLKTREHGHDVRFVYVRDDNGGLKSPLHDHPRRDGYTLFGKLRYGLLETIGRTPQHGGWCINKIAMVSREETPRPTEEEILKRAERFVEWIADTALRLAYAAHEAHKNAMVARQKAYADNHERERSEALSKAMEILTADVATAREQVQALAIKPDLLIDALSTARMLYFMAQDRQNKLSDLILKSAESDRKPGDYDEAMNVAVVTVRNHAVKSPPRILSLQVA